MNDKSKLVLYLFGYKTGFFIYGMTSNFVKVRDTSSSDTSSTTVKILNFGTPQTIAIIVLKLVKFDVTLH